MGYHCGHCDMTSGPSEDCPEHGREWNKQRPRPMGEFMLTDDKDDEYSYAASDMRMALVVHQQLHGTDVQRAEQI